MKLAVVHTTVGTLWTELSEILLAGQIAVTAVDEFSNGRVSLRDQNI